MMDKARRRKLILSIISSRSIQTQEELAAELMKNGALVTQATISRDIRELGLVKEPLASGGHRYRAPGREELGSKKHIFADLVASIDYSENLVVVKTVPAGAQSVASIIDSLSHVHILATLAGDDAVLVVVRPKEQAPAVAAELEALVNS
mgnify:CR=1 FL=1|jgi:transcriptional regulator of arginine metabolism